MYKWLYLGRLAIGLEDSHGIEIGAGFICFGLIHIILW